MKKSFLPRKENKERKSLDMFFFGIYLILKEF